MRSAGKTGGKALLADTRRVGLFVVSACKVVLHKRQARKVCSAGGWASKKEAGWTLQLR